MYLWTAAFESEREAWEFMSEFFVNYREAATVEEYSSYPMWKKAELGSQAFANALQLLANEQSDSHSSMLVRRISDGTLVPTHNLISFSLRFKVKQPTYSVDTWKDIHDWRNHPVVLTSGKKFATLEDATNTLGMQLSTSQSPKTFKSFSRLPLEIRRVIWQYAVEHEPRYVKLLLSKRYLSDYDGQGDTILWNCHLRQPGSPKSKLPTAFLYACRESYEAFVSVNKGMDLILPEEQSQVRLSDACPIATFEDTDRTVQCGHIVNQKGHINFRQDTLILEKFRFLTGVLSRWNGTKLNLSSVTSLFLDEGSLRRENRRELYENEPTFWRFLETECPSLQKLAISDNGFALPDHCSGALRLIRIDEDFLAEASHMIHSDAVQRRNVIYSKAKVDPELIKSTRQIVGSTLRTLLHMKHKTVNSGLRWEYLLQVRRNPAYWSTVSFEAGWMSLLITDPVDQQKMERVVVAPPPDERGPSENKLFWIERPKVVVPRLIIKMPQRGQDDRLLIHMPCRPDGTVWSMYEGIKDMFEGYQDCAHIDPSLGLSITAPLRGWYYRWAPGTRW
jgi:hypothetical protein